MRRAMRVLAVALSLVSEGARTVTPRKVVPETLDELVEAMQKQGVPRPELVAPKIVAHRELEAKMVRSPLWSETATVWVVCHECAGYGRSGYYHVRCGRCGGTGVCTEKSIASFWEGL